MFHPFIHYWFHGIVELLIVGLLLGLLLLVWKKAIKT